MSGPYRSGLIFPAVASLFPTVDFSSSVLCFLVQIASKCMSFSIFLPFQLDGHTRLEKKSSYLPLSLLLTTVLYTEGFTTSVGVLLASGHKITKHMLTTLFSPSPVVPILVNFLTRNFSEG